MERVIRGFSRPLFFVLFFTMFWALSGCSSPSIYDRMEAKQAGARPSRDTNASDLFYMGQPNLPERATRQPTQQWEFFYKDCELARRSLRPNRSEWECKGPQ